MQDAIDSPAALTGALQARLNVEFPARSLVFQEGRLSIRQAGFAAADRPAVVLLHGIGSGAPSWLEVAARLGRVAHVIAWDAPGYGNSTPLAQSAPRAEDYAARLLKMLDALGIQRCVLVGHSLGALTAMALATGTHAARVARLVLISPAQGYGAVGREARQAEVRAQRIANLERLGLEEMARLRSPYMLSPKASAEQLSWVQWNMARLNPHGYRQAIELLCGEDILRHPPLALPCEVHVGEADGITPPAACATIAQALGCDCFTIPEAGHASPIEQPQRVAGLLASAARFSLTGSAQ